jgi:hypothetical protein
MELWAAWCLDSVVSRCLQSRNGGSYAGSNGKKGHAYPTSDSARITDLIPGAIAGFEEKPHGFFRLDLIEDARAEACSGPNIPAMEDDRGERRC